MATFIHIRRALSEVGLFAGINNLGGLTVGYTTTPGVSASSDKPHFITRIALSYVSPSVNYNKAKGRVATSLLLGANSPKLIKLITDDEAAVAPTILSLVCRLKTLEHDKEYVLVNEPLSNRLLLMRATKAAQFNLEPIKC